MPEHNKKRARFSGKIGFVLAAASSAVGLGNIWRFPYLAAQYGGGTFLFIYLILAVTFGFSVMITEIAIGRMTRKSAVSAFSILDKRFSFCGILGTIIPVIITPYYGVIGGWVTKYIEVYMAREGHIAANGTYFQKYIASPMQPLFWFFVFIMITAVIVLLGVEKGIEKASVILMPVLIFLSVVIAIYTMTRPGAGPGIIYYLKPDFSKITGKTVLAALGQLFYSMSLAMGIMITYGSYMKKEDNLESSVRQIEFFDTLVAFLAGMMIIPAVYLFSNGDEKAMSAGPGLMFITLPKVFDSMRGGHVIGCSFFILVFFAALTSSISLMETIVSILMDKLAWKRKKATIVVTVYSLLMGIPSSLGFGIWGGIKPLGMDILDFWDFISNSVLMPILAFFTCVFAGYFLKPKKITEEIEQDGVRFRFRKFYYVMIRYVAPIGMIGILVSSVAASLGFFQW